MSLSSSRPPRSRHLMFTVNNWNPGHVEKLKGAAALEDNIKYMIFQSEIGEDGKTPHLQGYVQLKQAWAAQTFVNKTKCLKAWCETKVGANSDAMRDYCRKDETHDSKIRYEYGEYQSVSAGNKKKSSAGGKATQAKWKQFHEAVKADPNIGRLAGQFPEFVYRYSNGVKTVINSIQSVSKRTQKTCVHVFYGPPGVGKTQKAHELGGPNAYFQESQNGMWWCNYDGKSTVILDDFHGNIKFDYFKKLTDKYPMQVEVKGGMVNFNPSCLIVTSNKHPSEWWKPDVLGSHGLAALFRRIHVLQHWDEETKSFIDDTLLTFRPLWDEGCTCLTRTATNEDFAPTPVLSESSQDDQEVQPEVEADPAPNTDLKRKLFPDIPAPPKKVKTQLMAKQPPRSPWVKLHHSKARKQIVVHPDSDSDSDCYDLSTENSSDVSDDLEEM